MCNDICKKCGVEKCEKKCVCPTPNYKKTKCKTSVDTKCVKVEASDIIFPCLDIKPGDSMFDILQKLDKFKCDFINLPSITPVDQKVKTNASDISSGFLVDKLSANECISWTTSSVAGNIKMTPLLDFNCILSKIKNLPAFCTAVNNCTTVIPICNPVSNINVINVTENSISYSFLPGVGNTSFNISLFSDAALTVQVGATVTVTSALVTFNALTPNTDYWIKIQPICLLGGTVTSLTYGPTKTKNIVTPTCPNITINEPILINGNIATVTWIGDIGATSYNVYLNNVIVLTTTSLSYVSGSLPNGNYVVKIEALPCTGIPKYDSVQFNINTTPPCTPPSMPCLTETSISNTCPSSSIDLNSLLCSTSQPYIEWHTNGNHTALITNPFNFNISGLGSFSVYAFGKDLVTNCYSDPVIVEVNEFICAPVPNVVLNCSNFVNIISGTFIKNGLSHNGVIRVPISVIGSGNISGTVSGNGFIGSFATFVTATTAFIDINIIYNGISGINGNNLITITINAASIGNPIQTCNTLIPIACPTCNPAVFNIINISNTSFDVTVNSLGSNTYTINIIDLSNNQLIIQANNQTGIYSATGLTPGNSYSIEVIINCECGNSSAVSVQTIQLFNNLAEIIYSTSISAGTIRMTSNSNVYTCTTLGDGTTCPLAIPYGTYDITITHACPNPLTAEFTFNGVTNTTGIFNGIVINSSPVNASSLCI